MKRIQLQPTGRDLDYDTACALAASCAAKDPELEKPVVVAWHDKRSGQMSPAIPGGNPDTRWRDYAESHCGCLEVDVSEDFEFVFADAAPYREYGPSPYVNLADAEGRGYICLASVLRDPHRPDSTACMPLDEYTSKLT